MSFQTVEFTHGEELPEVDLDQMMANDHAVREEANYYPILTANCTVHEFGLSADSVTFLIDGVSKASFSGAGNKSLGNISLAAISEGLHTLTVRIDGGLETEDFDFKFYRSPEFNYMTLWCRFEKSAYTHLPDYQDDSFSTVGAYGITVLGHRVSKSWV